jgi:nucleoside-diphosphate-sugar epimerase
MKVMVLGATGFIGPAVVERLQALGHEALPVSRHGKLAADRSDPSAMARLAEAHRPDAVIDLLAMTLDATQPLLDALAGRTGRYVMASSGDVYRQYDGLHRKAGAAAPLEILAEDAPLRTGLYPYRTGRTADDPQAWMEGYDKIPIEAALPGRGFEATVVRLPMVFGRRDRQRRFAWAIGPMRAGKPVIDVDAAWAAWRTSYGYVDDVAHGLALAAVHTAAAGRTYNVGPAEAPDHAGWAERFASAIGWKGELRRVDRGAVPEPARRALDSLDLAYPMVTDTSRIRAELGYAEPTNPAEALARTVADEASRAA